MTHHKKRIFTGLAAAAGAVGAFFGGRALLRWYQNRSYGEQRMAAFQNRARARYTEGTQLEGARVEGTRYQPLTQPDRQPIPATGMPVMEQTAEAAPAATPAVMPDNLTAPLVQYLVTFHEMIQLVHKRRWENKNSGGVLADEYALTGTDRAQFQDRLDRLADQLPELDDSDLPNGSLQKRMYNLAMKVRDAMQNLDYSVNDLFRINGEVRSEACQLLDQILAAGPDLVEARRLYECG